MIIPQVGLSPAQSFVVRNMNNGRPYQDVDKKRQSKPDYRLISLVEQGLEAVLDEIDNNLFNVLINKRNFGSAKDLANYIKGVLFDRDNYSEIYVAYSKQYHKLDVYEFYDLEDTSRLNPMYFEVLGSLTDSIVETFRNRELRGIKLDELTSLVNEGFKKEHVRKMG